MEDSFLGFRVKGFFGLGCFRVSRFFGCRTYADGADGSARDHGHAYHPVGAEVTI